MAAPIVVKMLSSKGIYVDYHAIRQFPAVFRNGGMCNFYLTETPLHTIGWLFITISPTARKRRGWKNCNAHEKIPF